MDMVMLTTEARIKVKENRHKKMPELTEGSGGGLRIAPRSAAVNESWHAAGRAEAYMAHVRRNETHQ